MDPIRAAAADVERAIEIRLREKARTDAEPIRDLGMWKAAVRKILLTKPAEVAEILQRGRDRDDEARLQAAWQEERARARVAEVAASERKRVEHEEKKKRDMRGRADFTLERQQRAALQALYGRLPTDERATVDELAQEAAQGEGAETRERFAPERLALLRLDHRNRILKELYGEQLAELVSNAARASA
jgi:hypothetical protein